MRIDSYLWATRYFKTRTLSTKACRENKVKVNNILVKPSKEIYIGDQLAVTIGSVLYELQVIDFPKSRVGAKLLDLYRKDFTTEETFQKANEKRNNQEYYRQKGTGRPTKKDRRLLDQWLDDQEM